MRRVVGIGGLSLVAAGVILACSSFGGSQGSPPGTPDAPPTADADGADADSADADGGKPDPCSGFATASKSCGPGINVQNDPVNCGVCGRVCVPANCTAGVCVATDVATIPGGGQFDYFAGVDKDFVYVTAQPNALYRSPLDGGTPEMIASVDAGAEGYLFNAARIDGAHAFLRGKGEIMRTSSAPGSPVTNLGPTNDFDYPIDRLTTSATRVFFVRKNGIVAAPKDGSAAFTDYVPGQVDATEAVIAQDEHEIFWITAPSGGGGALHRKRGTDQRRLVTINAPASLRMDEDFVYWIERDTWLVRRLPRGAATDDSPTTVTQIPPENDPQLTAGFAVDGAYLYFFVSLTEGGNTSAIERVHRCGGERLRLTGSLANDFTPPGRLGVGGGFVYWSLYDDKIRRATK